jgi:hypothetical protein
VARIVPGNIPGQQAGQTALQTFTKKLSKHPITSEGVRIRSNEKISA